MNLLLESGAHTWELTRNLLLTRRRILGMPAALVLDPTTCGSLSSSQPRDPSILNPSRTRDLAAAGRLPTNNNKLQAKSCNFEGPGEKTKVVTRKMQADFRRLR